MFRACLNDCHGAFDFISEHVRPAVTTEVRKPRCQAKPMLGVLLRLLGLLRSALKLNEPGDFQSHSAIARAIFEIAVDACLLYLDADKTLEMYEAWEMSAKLKAAKTIEEYRAAQPLSSVKRSPQAEFIAKNEATIIQDRKRLWPGSNSTKPKQPKGEKSTKAKHPNRWTGRDLAADAMKAHKLRPELGFEEFYRSRYAMLNWHIHGSGLAGIKNMPAHEFPTIAGFALKDCADFAFVAIRLIVEALGLFDAAMEEEFEDVAMRRALATHKILTGQG